MASQIDLLKSETHAAEKDFHRAVEDYLLNPLETTEEFKKALTTLFESITNYRSVLDKLRKYLTVMRESEQLTTRRTTIEKAIVSLDTRDAALARMLRKVNRLAGGASRVAGGA